MSSFNLIDHPWLPVADGPDISLRELFSTPGYRMLGGTPPQKIALMKCLQAIAQAAATPESEAQWQAGGWQAMQAQCLVYLERWHDRFDLYGERPFLQMPAISAAKIRPYGAVIPEIATGNTSVLSQWQVEKPLSDAQKALLLLTQMGGALGGKKADNSVVLTPGYPGKTKENGNISSGGPGPAVASRGLLHSLVLGEHLLQTLWLNLFTPSAVQAMFPGGIGTPPWEQMPAGEDCLVAQQLKQTLMGRLVPLNRFCLLTETGLHYSEGILHANYADGVWDPTVAVDNQGKKPRAIWADPERRPWRQLTALLSFMGQARRVTCLQLQVAVPRALCHTTTFAIWSGGLRVSSNAGEQYPTGGDDIVDSLVWLNSAWIGEQWFEQLQAAFHQLERLEKTLYAACCGYFRTLNVEGNALAAQATHRFWQQAEALFTALVEACGSPGGTALLPLYRRLSGHIQQIYNQFCPAESARQLDAWAKCRPRLFLQPKEVL
ncbi:type I-E CRISPR-associated protein Cse1/CasA [Chimaeribacter coloradensis]|uniref:Type I-E CRISPR-associated protein Cse1/CasA n=1 Tax=Chimaeribacter coloradensis TaxID=2060068 RepID=A0A2N5E4V0_9GAMM|nr:type I-E CRISPR-associated protein Cse1/CasA [Chimaeribacter coloradensis]PLR36019.1 type I-E CRISPR-associated protein Cse1/CasA [Chimaeribacter coloradensis]